jgi:Arc-like DNA binding domain
MIARKRASGGGRKPKGELANLASPFSLRMPAGLRKQLEDAADRSGRSISQEMLRRVQSSFRRERHTAIDPSIRALCFLMSCIQQRFRSRTFLLNNVWSPPVTEGRHWRTDPFFFIAFKVAVQVLLEKFEPLGNDSPVTDKTPSEVGFDVANEVWWEVSNPRQYGFTLEEAFEQVEIDLKDRPDFPRSLEELRQAYGEILYGLADANRDLKLKTKGKPQ